jgi:hypothetical protein
VSIQHASVNVVLTAKRLFQNATALLLSDFFKIFYSDYKFFVIDNAKDMRQGNPNLETGYFDKIWLDWLAHVVIACVPAQYGESLVSLCLFPLSAGCILYR